MVQSAESPRRRDAWFGPIADTRGAASWFEAIRLTMSRTDTADRLSLLNRMSSWQSCRKYLRVEAKIRFARPASCILLTTLGSEPPSLHTNRILNGHTDSPKHDRNCLHKREIRPIRLANWVIKLSRNRNQGIRVAHMPSSAPVQGARAKVRFGHGTRTGLPVR